ncbi:uncharacterized protein LOC131940008 [Physella acuta]|uniref:uncharacterized protein LOC131940008 n=1 Tax=Physella acuta TaxID=109671 RepID=UPI0027DB911C|nr:uncharacterized protein LOC131940008 [Physella acuta]XP_059154527.1 uncharacterized protein LOC131940008 [Physella acuta]
MIQRSAIYIVAGCLSMSLTFGSKMVFQASTSAITTALTPTLKVNCSLESIKEMSTQFKNILSITITREDSEVIASVSACNPATAYSDFQTVSVAGDVTFTTSPVMGYLSLTWSNPDQQQAGTYTCNINGLTADNHGVMLTGNLTVQVREPIVNELVDVIVKIEKRLSANEELVKELAKKTKELETKTAALENCCYNQNKRVASLETVVGYLEAESSQLRNKVTAPLPCNNHYRNSEVFDNWDRIKEVAFIVYSNYTRVGDILFDGQDSTSISWFDQSRVLFATWKQIKTDATNYFSIEGDVRPELTRTFFINSNYNGCPEDKGWFVAVDRTNGICPWEQSRTFPVFKYSRQNEPQNWTNGDVAIADMFAVFVKYYSTA